MQRSWNGRCVPCVVTHRKIINAPLCSCIWVRRIVQKLFPGMFMVTRQVNEPGDKSHSQSCCCRVLLIPASAICPVLAHTNVSCAVQDPVWTVSAVFPIVGYLLGCCGRPAYMLEASFAWLRKCMIIIALVMAVG